MEKSIGIILMVIFGISGVLVTALAWLVPALELDKVMATAAGFIGVGFNVFQGFRFMFGHNNAELASVEITAEDPEE